MQHPKDSLVFSANSLQTFVTCERKFELQYIRELRWPDAEVEQVMQSEQFMDDGLRFHRMIERDLLGIPVPEPDVNEDPELTTWWRNYQLYPPDIPEGAYYPEKTMVGEIAGYPLVATYDLIVTTPNGRIAVFDWKTWRKPPRSIEWLLDKLQSKVYPYLLVQAAHVPGLDGAVLPEAVTMSYWYANFPKQVTTFSYSEAQFQRDARYLEEVVQRILQLEEGDYQLTEDRTQCKYCSFRSFCDRGDKAGSFDEQEETENSENFSLLGSLDDYESVAF